MAKSNGSNEAGSQNNGASSASNMTAGANTMWGGRFSAAPAEIMEQINASIAFDHRLYAQDIAGSRAHCSMLVTQGIISKSAGHAILSGLDQVEQEIIAGQFTFDVKLEDIHMHVEARLRDIVGEDAGRLHTARSRNDQVATDFRLWLREAIDEVDAGLADLLAALLDRAEEYAATVMPGFTHLQTAQPVTFGHHLMAYVEMIERDRGRLADCRTRLNECPLGAAALAGTSFPIDRSATAAALGFDRPARNSLDAVSARDFALEFLAAAAICSTHLSRFAEELVIWSSAQFRFVALSDALTTGSSIMPQKRNPDAAELVRGKCGRVVGDLIALLMVMKGLPLAYSKDMQEDKEPVFEAVDTLALTIPATAAMVRDLKANVAVMAAAAGDGFTTATDLADWLVRVKNLPFRDAHHISGAAVALAESAGKQLWELSIGDFQSIDGRITKDVLDVLSVASSLDSRTSFGGAAPIRVREAIAAARERLK